MNGYGDGRAVRVGAAADGLYAGIMGIVVAVLV